MLRGLGDGHWPQIWDIPSIGDPWEDWAQQLWLVASLGEGQLRFEIHECQVCWTDSTCEELGSMDMFEHSETVPLPWVNYPLDPRKVLEPEARRRTLQQKTYSFVAATAVLARSATVDRPLACGVELVRAS